MKWLPEWAGDAIAGVVLSAVTYLFHLGQRVTTIETLNIARDKKMEKLEDITDKHNELVVHLSTLVTEIKEAMPGLKDVGALVNRLDGVIEVQNRRIELVENVMLGQRSRHS